MITVSLFGSFIPLVTVWFPVTKEADFMPKRRANGEGNIRKRKDGRWEGRYTVGHDPETGKSIIKNVLGKTQAEVKEKLKKARGGGLFKVTVLQAFEEIAVFNHSKK